MSATTHEQETDTDRTIDDNTEVEARESWERSI